jgi:hypothetical protein
VGEDIQLRRCIFVVTGGVGGAALVLVHVVDHALHGWAVECIVFMHDGGALYSHLVSFGSGLAGVLGCTAH